MNWKKDVPDRLEVLAIFKKIFGIEINDSKYLKWQYQVKLPGILFIDDSTHGFDARKADEFTIKIAEAFQIDWQGIQEMEFILEDESLPTVNLKIFPAIFKEV